jgi:ankyrin repeat protein
MSKKILLNKCGPDIYGLTRELIDAHLDLLDETDSKGKTLLHILAGDGLWGLRINPLWAIDGFLNHTRIFNHIVQRGANLNIIDNDGMSALMYVLLCTANVIDLRNLKSCMESKTLSLKTLKDAQAYFEKEVMGKPNDHLYVDDNRYEMHFSQVRQMLDRKEKALNGTLLLSLCGDDIYHMTEEIINENKNSLNRKDKRRGGQTILHLLANDPKSSINNHAIPTVGRRDPRNVTRYTDIVKHIVNAGAIIGIYDDQGNTPLDYAIDNAVYFTDNENVKTFLEALDASLAKKVDNKSLKMQHALVQKTLVKGMDRCLELLHRYSKDDYIRRNLLQVGNMILNKLKKSGFDKMQQYENQIREMQLERTKDVTRRSIVHRGLKRSKKVKSKVAMHEKKASESEDCPVCLEKLYDIKQECVTLTSCFHSLHKECLRELVVNMKIKLCPVCKAPIKKVRPCSTFNVYDIKKDGVITKSRTRSTRRRK